ncbi:hypothetical protein N7517_011401 [Penicillium concentricum]|uniref:Fatty acid hydroxylase domain-containing protein n=1 Tax=Penicillium concentricum TaxID=293559 RepID=A0A9W9RAQ0_9EURO|nr:uncharacterized protein N7517_011401 [Penicillium concentricum]KAJ5356792.1 hypothetical protein N7517_011401 [Penicillium concentricum]
MTYKEPVVGSKETVWLTYDANKAPASLSWAWLPVEASLYGIILDFWFYWYHRVMHDVNGLWKFHRTNHLTKHPNPLLIIYADSEQVLRHCRLPVDGMVCDEPCGASWAQRSPLSRLATQPCDMVDADV